MFKKNIFYLTSLFVFFLSKTSEGKQIKKAKPNIPVTKRHACFLPKNPLCQKILTLNPNLDKDYALNLSNAFHRVAKKFQIPKDLLVSIAKQESNFRLDAVREVSGLILDEDGYKQAKVGSDFCMMQINALNILRMKFDAKKLTEDVTYCLEAGAKILTWAKKYKDKDPEWWTRYNAVSDIHRQTYKKHVLKHWRKLDPQVDNQLTCSVDVTTP